MVSWFFMVSWKFFVSTHLFPIHAFSTPWKHYKTLRRIGNKWVNTQNWSDFQGFFLESQEFYIISCTFSHESVSWICKRRCYITFSPTDSCLKLQKMRNENHLDNFSRCSWVLFTIILQNLIIFGKNKKVSDYFLSHWFVS